MPILTTEQIQQAIERDDGVITAPVSVDLDTIMDGIEALNDHVTEQLVGSAAFTDISYEVAPEQTAKDAVTLLVTGVVDEDALDSYPEESQGA